VCESPISDRVGVEDTDSDGIDVILPQHTKITDHTEITCDPPILHYSARLAPLLICSVLQWIVACCSVVQCVAVCCSVSFMNRPCIQTSVLKRHGNSW